MTSSASSSPSSPSSSPAFASISSPPTTVDWVMTTIGPTSRLMPEVSVDFNNLNLACRSKHLRCKFSWENQCGRINWFLLNRYMVTGKKKKLIPFFYISQCGSKAPQRGGGGFIFRCVDGWMDGGEGKCQFLLAFWAILLNPKQQFFSDDSCNPQWLSTRQLLPVCNLVCIHRPSIASADG